MNDQATNAPAPEDFTGDWTEPTDAQLLRPEGQRIEFWHTQDGTWCHSGATGELMLRNRQGRGTRYRIHCTCDCLRPATHLEPAEWQQDPDCPVHPMTPVDEPEQPIAHLRDKLGAYETARVALGSHDAKYREANSGAIVLAGQGLALAAQRVLDAIDAGVLLLPEPDRTEDLVGEGCEQGTVDPWVDRTELLRIASGKASNGGGIVPLAARLEAFVLHGSDLGQPLPDSTAREVLHQALASTDAWTGSDQRIAREVVEWLGHQGYAITKAPEVAF